MGVHPDILSGPKPVQIFMGFS